MIVFVNKWGDINFDDYSDPTSEKAFKTARRLGTLNLIIEVTEVTVLYSVKTCFLILYYRLT